MLIIKLKMELNGECRMCMYVCVCVHVRAYSTTISTTYGMHSQPFGKCSSVVAPVAMGIDTIDRDRNRLPYNGFDDNKFIQSRK